jgi:hypothetical protein
MKEFNSTKFNSIEISIRTLMMFNPKEKNILFYFILFTLFRNVNSIQLNMNLNMFIQCVWIQFKNFNSNQMQLGSIQFKWNYAKSFNIKSFKW